MSFSTCQRRFLPMLFAIPLALYGLAPAAHTSETTTALSDKAAAGTHTESISLSPPESGDARVGEIWRDPALRPEARPDITVDSVWSIQADNVTVPPECRDLDDNNPRTFALMLTLNVQGYVTDVEVIQPDVAPAAAAQLDDAIGEIMTFRFKPFAVSGKLVETRLRHWVKLSADQYIQCYEAPLWEARRLDRNPTYKDHYFQLPEAP